MKKKPTDVGANRSGTQTAPMRAKRTAQGAQTGDASAGAGGFPAMHAGVHRAYARDAEPIGTMPPPGTVKGMAKAAKDALGGRKATLLLDKIGERLAFERTGTRLYDGLLLKFEVCGGSWDGGPTRAELQRFRDEEHQHFTMLCEAMRRLGADPTAMTPSADLAAVESEGIEKVIHDVRTTLDQALHALLVAELTDLDGWDLLVQLAESFGQDEIAAWFRDAAADEAEHLTSVRAWCKAHAVREGGVAPVG